MTGRKLIFRNTVMFVTALGLWTTWLPMMRTLSGQNSYAWGNEYFNTMYRGVGWSGDYLFLIYQAVLGVTILWMGFRNPRAPFKALLVIWHAIPFANALYLPFIAGQKIIFHGDTGEIRWDLTWIAPLVTGITFFVVICWIIYDRREGSPQDQTPAWTKINTRLVILFALYLVGVTILEWTGPTHGATDVIAVPLNILAPTLIALMFYPWKKKRVSTSD